MDAPFTQDAWEVVSEVTDGTASVLQFRQTKFQTIVKQIHQPKPRSIPDIATTSNLNDFHVDLKLSRSSQDISHISEITLKQATSDERFQYRIGMITASTAHEVLQKVDKQFNFRSVHAANNLCAGICGYTKPVSRAALS